MSMKSKGMALFLWAFGLMGMAGFHRFYLGKVGTGVIWCCTLGLFGVGTLIDFFTLGGMVEQVNTKKELKEIRTATLANARNTSGQ